jgi:predicted nucleic acid-binding protein
VTILADSQVVLAALRADDEPDHEAAAALLLAAAEERLTLHVLTLTPIEVSNVLVRAWGIEAQRAVAMLAGLHAAHGEPLPVSEDDLAAACRLAAQHGITTYDASYAAVAARRGMRLVSGDRRHLVSNGLAIDPQAAAAGLSEPTGEEPE